MKIERGVEQFPAGLYAPEGFDQHSIKRDRVVLRRDGRELAQELRGLSEGANAVTPAE